MKTEVHDDSPEAVALQLVEALDRERQARGESKAAVARGAGLGEPAVRRLLSGAHGNPTIKTLSAVAGHLGLRLTLEPAPSALTVPSIAALRDRASEIDAVVAAHGGSNVRVFGSVARGDARPGSDVDLLIDVQPGTGLFEIGAIEDELEALLGWRVDVVTSGHATMAHIDDEAVGLW